MRTPIPKMFPISITKCPIHLGLELQSYFAEFTRSILKPFLPIKNRISLHKLNERIDNEIYGFQDSINLPTKRLHNLAVCSSEISKQILRGRRNMPQRWVTPGRRSLELLLNTTWCTYSRPETKIGLLETTFKISSASATWTMMSHRDLSQVLPWSSHGRASSKFNEAPILIYNSSDPMATWIPRIVAQV